MMDNKPRIRMVDGILNIVHLIILLGLFIYTFRAVVCIDAGYYAGNLLNDFKIAVLNAGINEIFTYIGALAFVLFGIIGIYDFAYSNGLRFLTPPIFALIKEKNYEKQAEKMMQTYYEKDIEFIREYEKERIGFMLQSMGIEETQFHHIRYELVKARAMPIRTRKELKQKAERIVYDKRFIIDQTGFEKYERVYRDVDYFINLYTALYDTQLCVDVSKIMANFIVLNLKKRIDEVDYIVIPQGSNLLLGLEVGKLLRKPVIAIQEYERIRKQEFWDGNYIINENRKNNIIIIHDVLVSGKRIYESVGKLPKNTFCITGLFCLIKYKNIAYRPEGALKKHGIHNIKYLIKTDEKILSKIYNMEKE